jgi:DNA repair protein RadC
METTYIRETILRYGRKVECERVRGPEGVARLFRKVVKDNTKEHFVVFHLDGAHEVASYTVAHVGTANLCPAHPREIFRAAIWAGACAIVVAHNHPSQCLEPSEEDLRLTRRLREAGEVVGIKVLDSVIVTDDGYRSVLD